MIFIVEEIEFMEYLFLLIITALIVTLFALTKSKPKPVAKKRDSGDKALQEAMVAREKINANIEQIKVTDDINIEFHLDEIPKELSNLNLLNWSDSQRSRDDLIQLIKNIKRPKSLFNELLNSSYDPKEYAILLASDPIITAKILNHVNSAAFALSNKISDVHHAIVYLGSVFVKNLAIEVSMHDLFPDEKAEIKNAYKQFWVAGNVSSLLSLRIAQKIMVKKPVQIATTSMLTFLGNLAYISAYPDNVSEYMEKHSLIDRIVWEQSQNGANSAILGRLLAESWQLPEAIAKSLGNSYKFLILSPNEIQFEDKKEKLISYLCCRVGEHIAVNGIAGINDFSFMDSEDPNFFYLSQHLKNEQLENIFNHLNDNKLKNELRATCRVLNI
jgi:HD-like signal output (HDOD) protein